MLLGIFGNVGDYGDAAAVRSFEKQQQAGGIDCAVMLVVKETAGVKTGIPGGMNAADIDLDGGK